MMRNDTPRHVTGNPIHMIVDTRGSPIQGVRTEKDMSEEELRNIELQYGMPINRNPKPKPVQEPKMARHLWARG
jgi:hypothetical protein